MMFLLLRQTDSVLAIEIEEISFLMPVPAIS